MDAGFLSTVERIKNVRESACQLGGFKKKKSSVKMKERNGTNNVKGLTNDLHTIFSASKLQDHGDDKGSGSLCENDPPPQPLINQSINRAPAAINRWSCSVSAGTKMRRSPAKAAHAIPLGFTHAAGNTCRLISRHKGTAG